MASPSLASEAAERVSAFLAPEPLPLPTLEVVVSEVAFQSTERLGDMGIALGFILALHLLGLGLKRSGARSLRPAVFTSTLVAIPMLFWVNMDFYDLHRVSADATGLTIERYMGPDDRIAWAEVRALEVLDGAPFPVMTDDRSLRVVGAQGASCVLPRYVPEVDAIVALGLKHIQAASTLPKEATP